MENKIEKLIALLQAAPELQGTRIRSSFDSAIKGEPLRQPVITVGLGGAKFRRAFLEESAPIAAELSIRFILYSPLRTGSGEQCRRMLSALIKALAFQQDIPFTGFACTQVSPQRDAGAYALQVTADCRDYVTKEDFLVWNP